MEDCQQNRGATADLWPAFKRVVRGRRSIRSFQDKPVPRHLVAEMLEAARQAPSSGNTQPWHFYVVTDPEIRERLVASTFPGADCGSDRVQDWVRQAPVLIVVCLDWRRGATKYNFEHRYFLGLQDVGAAIENLLLSAEALGLGACWVGGIRFLQVAEVLGIPPDHEPVALIPVGYPETRPGEKRLRPPQEVITWPDEW